MSEVQPTQPTVLAEAQSIITGARRESYGNAKESFERIATMWSVLMRATVTPAQVAQCMIAFKLVRESHKHSRDNLVDIGGYTGLLETITDQMA